MKTQDYFATTTCPNTVAARSRTTCAAKLLALLLLALPAAVQAQDYTYTTNDDNTITITGYTGSGGDVTIPDTIDGFSVTSIGEEAFCDCSSLTSVYFKGNAPNLRSNVFYADNNATVYYLPGTTGWENFAQLTGLPTAFWLLPYPLILNNGPSFGVLTNRFGFIISWATNISVVVEACSMTNPTWVPLQTNTLIGGSCYFSDPDWTNYPVRCYRLRSP
jgi:hypothetical protein